MEPNAFCYYAVPSSLAIFGLGMYFFLRKCMKDEPTKIERELKKINADIKN